MDSPRLRRLRVDLKELSREDAICLESSPQFSALESLHLVIDRLANAAALVDFLGAFEHAKFEVLALGERDAVYDAAAIKALCRSSAAGYLRALSLSYGTMTADGRALAQCGNLTALYVLSLAGIRLGDAGLAALVQGNRLPALESLSIRERGLGPGAIRSLATSRLPSTLRKLDLDKNRLDDAGGTGAGVVGLSEARTPQSGAERDRKGSPRR